MTAEAPPKRSLRGRRVLVLRNDRIGDLVLALPTIQALKDAGATVGVLVSDYTRPLLEGDPRVDLLLSGGEGALERVKAGRFDAALLLWATWANAWLARRAGIPLRVGPSGRPFSWLQNPSLPIRRSAAVKSEAEYNLDHLAPLGLRPALKPAPLMLDPGARPQARAWLKRLGLAGGRGPLVALHPGTGGSSSRWPLEFYVALGEDLRRELGARLLISGGPAEQPQVQELSRALGRAPCLEQPLALPVFAALLAELDLFVSAATGPMHMAGAVGAATLSFFPPLRAMAAARWHPLSRHRAVLTPPGLGQRMPRRGLKDGRLEASMRLITPYDALQAAKTVLRLKGSR